MLKQVQHDTLIVFHVFLIFALDSWLCKVFNCYYCSLQKGKIMLEFYIEKLIFNSGNELDLTDDDIVVFVGPNNSGKTQILRDVDRVCTLAPTGEHPIVLNKCNIKKSGTDEDLIRYFDENIQNRMVNGQKYFENTMNVKNTGGLYRSGINVNLFNSENSYSIDKFFISNLDSDNRLNILKEVQLVDYNSQVKTHPFHHLHFSKRLEKKLNNKVFEAFGKEVILNKWSGLKLYLNYGERVDLTPEQKDDLEYCTQKLNEKTKNIAEQGSGVKCYTSIILNILTSERFVTLIDEPEVFLHPPQVKLLGEVLVKDKKPKQQYFISTHSADFIKGLISKNGSNVKIVRVTREGEVGKEINPIKFLDNDSIKELWEDSLLRHSNIIEGLFYEQVIICESDSDCRFYSAIFNSIYDNTEEKRPDILWAHPGSNNRIANMVEYLHPLGVKTKVVVDFDTIRNKNIMKKLYEAFDKDFSEIGDDIKKVEKEIKKLEKNKKDGVEDIKKELHKLIEKIQSPEHLSGSRIDKIREIVEDNSVSSMIKKTGRDVLEDKTSFDNLNEKLKASNVFVVEVGELKSFDKGLGVRKQHWVNEVLEKNKLDDKNTLIEAKEFIKNVVSS